MVTVWGIHNNQPSLDLVGDGFVGVGWDKIGDLSAFSTDRDSLKATVAAAYPEAKPGAIPVWAGVLNRFAFQIALDDLIISPERADSTINFGQVTSDYYWDTSADVHRHRRNVQWIKTGVPRATFSQTARYEIGSAVTLFRVKNHAQEFLTFASVGTTPSPPTGDTGLDAETVTASIEEEPSADRIETYSRDFVIDALYGLDPYRFEHFVAALLRAMGYRAQPTKASGDGGVDVIASRDPLGLEPPIVKVQCKKTLGTIGGPDIQKLVGTLAHGGSEVGLFVTLGSYSNDAAHIERTRQDLRLINATQLVEMIFDHYEALEPEWRRLLPL